MFATIAFLFLSIAPVFISSLQCNVCRQGVRVNYTVTSDNVPMLPTDCIVIEAGLCRVSVFWELDVKRTYMEFDARPGKAVNPSRDMVSVRIFRGMENDNETLSSARELNYECDSMDKCNGPEGLKKVLSALTVEDQFQTEIAPLLKIVAPFDPRTADCQYVHNTTFRCPPPDMRRCQRCVVELDEEASHTEHVCATCGFEDIRDNNVERFKTFVLSNPSEDIDVAGLACQSKSCNTAENANKVFQASKITFNTEKYFKK